MTEEPESTSLMPFVIAIAVLGLVAVVILPNLIGDQEGGRRSKVARAKSEIRNLAVNLETYYIDHNTYPPAVDANGNIVPLGEDGELVSAGYVPWMLTTPIAYTSSLPGDPFVQSGGYPVTYRYATNGLSCWILASDGPDLDVDIQVTDYPDPAKGNCSYRTFLTQFGGSAIEYDGTNGTTSSGDVLRVGP